MAKKRAPGGGRKPKGRFSNLTSSLTVRMPDDLREQLEAAAKRRRSSLGQELINRVKLSFDRERAARRDPASRALCYLLAEVISTVASNTRQQRDWRSDPFSYRVMKLAFSQILDALEPPGEIRTPEKLAAGEWAWGIPGAGLFQIGGSTPEEMARFTRDVILMRLAEPAPSPTGGPDVATLSIPNSQQEFEFAMSDVRRDLEIKEEPKP